jgi:hypothetical protein
MIIRKKYVTHAFLLLFIAIFFGSCGLFTQTMKITDDNGNAAGDNTGTDVESADDTANETLPIPEITEEIITDPPDEITVTDTVPPVTNALSISGKIESTSNQLLKLHIEWTATQGESDTQATVTCAVYFNTYAIICGSRNNSKITFNGEETVFATDPIMIESNSLSTIKLYEKSYEVDNSADNPSVIDVSSSFYFGGTYGGVSIGWIEVAGSITLSDNGTNTMIPAVTDPVNQYQPEEPEEPFIPIVILE